MAKVEVNTKFFHFRQNNSGGKWVISDEKGLGPNVWIEALDKEHAVSRAKNIGIYFDGVAHGSDCDCCGDRWSEPWGDDKGEDQPSVDDPYNFHWHPVVFVHHLNGEIERIEKTEGAS